MRRVKRLTRRAAPQLIATSPSFVLLVCIDTAQVTLLKRMQSQVILVVMSRAITLAVQVVFRLVEEVGFV